MSGLETVELYDTELTLGEMPAVLAELKHNLVSGTKTRVGFLNGSKVYQLDHCSELKRSMNSMDYVFPDGMSVAWASRLLLRRGGIERIAGIDLFKQLLELAAAESFSVYLLGATEDVNQKLRKKLRGRYPDLEIAGGRNGYFEPDEVPGIISEVNEAGPDMIFLGFPSPDKENFIHDYGDQIDATLLMGVGGAFDVLAGKRRRAPGWVQKLGLEWFYRFCQEPGRLWKRNLVANPYFVWKTFLEVFRG